MFANHQYQYQQTGGTAVSTGGMVWNGSAWVATTTAGGHGVANGHTSYSTAPYGVAANSIPPAPAVETPAAKIAKFTQYYHQWTQRANEQEEQAQRLPLNSPQRTDVQRNADWAKFYADQSSRAAHHFHSTPYAPAPFELPPAPQSAAAVAAAPVVVPQPQQPVVPQQPVAPQQHPQQFQPVTVAAPAKKASRWSSPARSVPQSSSSTQGGPPDSLKRYVHRCLEQCKTPEQTKAIERETEKVIAQALQEGTLHTKNWEFEPLIPVPGVVSAQSLKRPASYNPYLQHTHQNLPSKKPKLNSSDSYYGPPSSGGSPTSFSSSTGPQDHNHGGHYGPFSSPSYSTNPTASSYQPQQQSSKYQGHYGPGAAVDEDFISVPKLGKGGFKKNKYVNPNSVKKTKKAALDDEGLNRSSKALAKRANRFSGPGGNSDVRTATAKGIDDRYMGKGVIGGGTRQLDEMDYEQMKVKGTCQKLEKQYLRLTAPPKAECVRPLEILTLHMINLKKEWRSKNRRDYLWFCAEMKAVRQDLTVQHIQNAFTVDVYETHARMALQEGDMNEFNQSQTQLKILYDKLDDPKALENENEFVAYRMIYFVVMSLNKGYKGGSSDVLKLLLSLTPAQRQDPAIKHSLQLRAAVADMSYHKFFQLYSSCPNLGDKLIVRGIPTMRHWALQRICRAYRPSVEVAFTLKELGFSVEGPKDIEDGKKYLLSCGCLLSDDGTDIKTKETAVRESDLEEKQTLH